MLPQVLSGARTILSINGGEFAAGFVMDYSIDTDAAVIQGIDNVYPDEIAPQTIMVSMNLKVYRTPNNDPVTLEIAPDSEGIDAQDSFLSSPYIQIEIRDKVSQKTIFYIQRGWVTRRTGNMEATGLLTETWTVRSIGFIGPDGQPFF